MAPVPLQSVPLSLGPQHQHVTWVIRRSSFRRTPARFKAWQARCKCGWLSSVGPLRLIDQERKAHLADSQL